MAAPFKAELRRSLENLTPGCADRATPTVLSLISDNTFPFYFLAVLAMPGLSPVLFCVDLSVIVVQILRCCLVLNDLCYALVADFSYVVVDP
jgi:hypothetical protein